MTATLKKPNKFQELLKLNFEWVSKKEAIILDKSFSSHTERGMLKEVDMVRCLRPNLNKFFYSISIDFSRTDKLTDDFLNKVCVEYLQLNGFVLHQYIMFRYDDIDNIRVNILVVRIGFDGKLNFDGYDHSRSEKALGQLRRRYNIRK